jgi:hypothetical protein
MDALIVANIFGLGQGTRAAVDPAMNAAPLDRVG